MAREFVFQQCNISVRSFRPFRLRSVTAASLVTFMHVSVSRAINDRCLLLLNNDVLKVSNEDNERVKIR